MNLEGRNIIVTGAGQGIGYAVARLIVDLGGKLIVVDMQGDKVNALADSLGAGSAEAPVGSVADPSFVQAMVDQVAQKHGAIHGLVNHAGIVRAAMINKMLAATWQQVIDVNLSGVFIACGRSAATCMSGSRRVTPARLRSSIFRRMPAAAAASGRSTMAQRNPGCWASP